MLQKNSLDRITSILVVAIVVMSSINALAEESEPGFMQRDTLTGNWGGFRDQLAEKGVRLDLEVTEYYQGMFLGDGNDDFEFGGRDDALVSFDTKKIGIWDGGGLHIHLTYRSGDLPAFRGGSLWPVNTGSILPLHEKDSLAASSLYLSQRFGDSASVLLGKVNAVDLLAADPFFGGWGNHRFMNLAFVAPPSGVVPPVIMGAVANYRAAPYILTFMVFDPADRTGDYWPDDLFTDGVNLSFGATRELEFFGRRASISFTGTYSTEDQANLSEIVLPPELRTGVKYGAYNFSLKISHLLIESPISPGEGLGIYARAAMADGNPNPIETSFTGGLAGYRLVPGRLDDVFGIGYFYYDFSEDLKSAVQPLLNFDHEQGFEIFYNLAVTPWFRVAADLQWISPASSDNDDVWVGGLRLNIRF